MPTLGTPSLPPLPSLISQHGAGLTTPSPKRPPPGLELLSTVLFGPCNREASGFISENAEGIKEGPTRWNTPLPWKE